MVSREKYSLDNFSMTVRVDDYYAEGEIGSALVFGARAMALHRDTHPQNTATVGLLL